MAESLDLLATGAGLDVAQPVEGLDLLADPNAPGPFRKGLGSGVAGLKSSFYGAGALAAQAVGAKRLEQAAIDAAAEQGAIASESAQPIENVDWSSPGAIANQFKFLLGQAVPSLATMFAGGVVGRGLGAVAGRTAAKRAAAESAKRTGMFAGAVAPDVAMEAGSIYPEALETGVANPAARAAVGGAVAASFDFLPLLAAERYLKAAGRGGFGAMAKGAAKGAPVGALLEGTQEALQTGVERLAAGHELTGPEAVSDYLNSFAAGAAPGTVLGGVVGAARGRAPAVQQPAPFTERELSTIPEQAPTVDTQDVDTSAQVPTLTPDVQHAAATQAMADTSAAIEQVRAEHEAAGARMKELEAEAKLPNIADRRTMSDIVVERKALTAARKATKGKITALETQYDAARKAAAALEPQIAAMNTTVVDPNLGINDPNLGMVDTPVAPVPSLQQELQLKDGTIVAANPGAMLGGSKEWFDGAGNIIGQSAVAGWRNAGDTAFNPVVPKTEAEHVQEATKGAEAFVAQQGLAPAPVQVPVKKSKQAGQKAPDLIPAPVSATGKATGAVRDQMKAREPALRELITSKLKGSPGGKATIADATLRRLTLIAQNAHAETTPEAQVAYIKGEIVKQGLDKRFPAAELDSVVQDIHGAVVGAATRFSKGASEIPVDSRSVVAALLTDFGGNAKNAADYAEVKAKSTSSAEMKAKYLHAASVLRGETLLSKGAVTVDKEAVNRLYEERFPDAQDAVMREFLARKPGARQRWVVIPAARLTRIWREHERTGVVRDIKGLDAIAERVIDNVLRLQVNTELLGHTQLNPDELFEQYVGTAARVQELSGAFGDYAVDEYGAWRLSDYGLDKLLKIAEQLVSAATPEQKLMLVDMALNVVHQRSDLAAAFVEGGSTTLANLSTKFSVAALTSDQFELLPQAAKEAAVDYYDRVMTERGNQLIQRVRDLVGPANLTVTTFTAAPGSPIGGYTRTGPLKAMISLALNAKNGLSVADHEGFHAAEDLVLDGRERQIITNALKNGRPLFNRLLEKVQQYDLENKTNLADEIQGVPAERRAYAFEFWKRGELEADGPLQRVFQKIQQFLERIANAVNGLGFQSIEDIFTALDRGQYSGRARNEASGIAGLDSRAARAEQTESVQFKAWFGDSKVVDAEGKPLVVYHGTEDTGFSEFEIPAFFTEDKQGAAWYENRSASDSPSRGTYEVYLSIKNPFDARDERGAKALIRLAQKAGVDAVIRNEDQATGWDFYSADVSKYTQYEGDNVLDLLYLTKVRDALRAAGYDGVRAYDTLENQQIPTWIPLSKPQIKSAIGNRGTFDPSDPDILRSMAERQSWYRSQLNDAVAALPTKVAPPQGWKDQIKGLVSSGKVKQAEIDAVGLNDWLDMQQGKVSKEQVSSFLAQNGVRVEETVLGHNALGDRPRNEVIAEWARDMAAQDGKDWATLSEAERGDYERDAEQEAAIEDMGAGRDMPAGSTKFAGYQLPGGQNYRELLLTLPSQAKRTVEQSADGSWRVVSEGGSASFGKTREEALKNFEAQQKGVSGFVSSHFDQPNILAHIRFNERTDAEGKRVLFIEEIQSDWAQKGKKEGFVSARKPVSLTSAEESELARLMVNARQIAGFYNTPDGIRAAELLEKKEPGSVFGKVPSAPFVQKTEAWVALSLKRMIRYAAENGFDKVAWTNGIQQAERYSLSKKVLSIEWSPVMDTTKQHITINTQGGAIAVQVDKDGRVVTEMNGAAQQLSLMGKPLDEIVGKDVAEKIVGTHKGRLAGSGLDIGGEGMKAFYDKIVPNVANDILKKLGGGRVESVQGVVPRGIENQRYEGPGMTEPQVRAVSNNFSQPAQIQEQAAQVARLMREGDAFMTAIAREGSATLAEVFGGKMVQDEKLGSQPGFTITPELAIRAANGLPLFSKAAVDMDRQMKAGELQQMQANQAGAALMEATAGTSATWQATVEGLGLEATGGFARWWNKYISTSNFIAHFSDGFKNVFGVLNTYNRYSSVLIKQMLKEQMPEWYTARRSDQDATFAALTKRNVGKFVKGSPEYQDLLATLTPEQQTMFASATRMVEGFLLKELEVDKVFYKQAYSDPKDYDAWLTGRQTQVDDLIAHGYEPLERFGDHTVTVLMPFTDAKGRVQNLAAVHQQFESQADAHKMAEIYKAELARTGSTLSVETGIRHKTSRDATISVQQFIDTARRNGVALSQPETERIVKALTAADSIVRNRMMRRKEVPGYSTDGMRVLNSFGVKMAGKIAYAKFASAIDASLHGTAVDSDLVRGPNGEMIPEIVMDAQRTVQGVMETVDDFKARNLWEREGAKGGFARNLADEVSDFVLVPDHTGMWSRKLRAAAMMYFIGGSISGAVVNVMSVPMLLVPELSIHTDYQTAAASTLSAWKLTWQHQAVLRDIVRLKDKDNNPLPGIDEVPGLREALITASEDGRTMDTEIHQITGMAQGAMFSQSRTVQKAMDVWMTPFRLSEQTNRITSFIAAYKVAATGKGIRQADGSFLTISGQELYRFAGGMVDATQNNYNAANRPGAARHPIYAMMFMFKSFPLFMTEAIVLMHKANPKSAVYMLLGLTLMTGVQGLPFAETLMDLIDTLSQRVFGSPFNTRRAMRNVIKSASEAMVGYNASDLVMRGMLNEVLGISMASRIGMGDFVPGTRLGAAESEQGRILQDLLGAPYAMVKDGAANIGKFAGGVFTGDWKPTFDALRAGGPIAVRNVIKGSEQLADGFASDARGRKVTDVTGMEAILQLAGLAPATVAKMYDYESINIQTKAFYNQVSRDMQDQLVQAMKDNDTVKVQEINDLRTAWNQSNPTMQILPNAAAVRRAIILGGVALDRRSQMLWGRRIRGENVFSEGSE